MKYYKENGVNPLSGCLPLIPQMIIFFSLFYVLREIATWRPGQPTKYGLTPAVLESAQRATIFGVHLYDKLLFRPGWMHLSVQQVIVIVLTVLVSAATTFMTVRQSAKRGLMQTNVDPDNPMAQSQKFMQYIVPFFSLTGLYWQYGLVLYWVTTNLWTLGQQYIMFRNWNVEPAQPAGAAAGAGGAVQAQGSARALSGGSGKGGSGKGGSGKAKAVPGRQAPAANRAGTASTPGAGGPAEPAANGQNGADKRGLLRLGRPKQAAQPEPEPETPAAKVVRQQPVRQSKSKRSGKR